MYTIRTEETLAAWELSIDPGGTSARYSSRVNGDVTLTNAIVERVSADSADKIVGGTIDVRVNGELRFSQNIDSEPTGKHIGLAELSIGGCSERVQHGDTLELVFHGREGAVLDESARILVKLLLSQCFRE